MLVEGKAKLAGWLILTTKSGQRAVVEAIEEVIFPMEFEPGQVAVSVQMFGPGAAQGEGIKVTPKIHAEGLAPVPTAFTTRNTGVTFEIEPVLAPDGETVDMNIVPQHVRLLRWTPAKIKHGEGKEVTVEQPVFSTLKVTTSLALKSGQRKLLGTYKLEDPPGHLELFLLRVEVQKLPASPAAPAPQSKVSAKVPGLEQ